MAIRTLISSNLAAESMRPNLNKALESATKAASQISTGARMGGAAETAVGTGLRVNATTLEIGAGNARQGQSVLSMADGSLLRLLSLVERQKALSVMANNGAYSEVERGYQNAELQQLTLEIDRVVDTTEFNGLKIMNGSLDAGGGVELNNDGTIAKSSLKIQFNAASATADDTNIFNINGVAFNAKTSYAYDSTNNAITIKKDDTASQKATALAEIINNTSGSVAHSAITQLMRDRLSDITAVASGDTVTLTSKKVGNGGVFSASFNAADTNDILSIQSGATTLAAAGKVNSSFDAGSVTGGLGVSNVTVVGTMGHSILQASSQINATSGWVTVSSSDLQDGDTVTVFGRSFALKDAVSNTETQIKRNAVSSLETLKNVVTFLNNSTDPDVANYTYEARENSGNAQIRITAKGASAYHNGVGFTIGANTFTVDGSSGGTGAANGVANGIDLSHITDNTGFHGAISGFEASMTGSDSVKLSVVVGNYTYEGVIMDTTPAANSLVRMKSVDPNGKGGYFDITLAANQGVGVSTQVDADTFAANVNSAIKELSFYQTKSISSLNVANTVLEETTATMTSKGFSNIEVQKVDVRNSRSSTAQEAKISITLGDGRIFENDSDLNEAVSKGQKIDFVNSSDNNEKLSIIFGRDMNLSDATTVSNSIKALLKAFNADKRGMEFQVGVKSDQVIAVSIQNVSTEGLFNGESLDITTIDGARKASGVIDGAINVLKGMRATIGAVQSRFEAAEKSIETGLQSTKESASNLLEADIAKASTDYSVSMVLVKAGISMLAQINMLPQELLKLIG